MFTDPSPEMNQVHDGSYEPHGLGRKRGRETRNRPVRQSDDPTNSIPVKLHVPRNASLSSSSSSVPLMRDHRDSSLRVRANEKEQERNHPVALPSRNQLVMIENPIQDDTDRKS